MFALCIWQQLDVYDVLFMRNMLNNLAFGIVQLKSHSASILHRNMNQPLVCKRKAGLNEALTLLIGRNINEVPSSMFTIYCPLIVFFIDTSIYYVYYFVHVECTMADPLTPEGHPWGTLTPDRNCICNLKSLCI